METKKLRLLSVALLLLATGATQADEVEYMLIHAYLPAYDQSLLLDNIDKITFSDEGIEVALYDADNVAVPFGQFRSITFGNKSAIEESPINGALRVTYRSTDATVVVESPLPIKTIGIYNLQGLAVRHESPHSEQVILSLDGYPRGIYIVLAENGETTITRKIVKTN